MMKPCTLLLLALLGSATIVSAQLPDSCAASTMVRRHYQDAAKIIALRQMLGDTAWADSIYIPAVLYNPVLNALSAVYNASAYPERDTVTDCLNIQAFASPVNPGGITVSSDTTNLWARRLFLGLFPTNNPVIDDLLVRYRLQLTGSSKFDQFFFFFDTDELLNTVALSALFDSIPGTHAEPTSTIGGGGDITLDTVASGVTLSYSVAWGDCPAGCIFHRTWTFLVRPDCSVQFLGAQGDPLTDEVACNSNFGCTTESLCLPWLQDSLQNYTAQHPDCQSMAAGIHVTLYQKLNAVPVIGIHVVIGIDAASTDFFYCNGDYIGSCFITIGGPGCTPDNVSEYFEADTIWSCAQPLPTPANCGITAAPVPVMDALSFQLLPNPSTTGQVMVQADFATRRKGKVTVFNVLGKPVLERAFEADQLTEPLDLAGQQPGVYFVRLAVGVQTATRKLLLIRP